jgi:hypothetical protein
VNQLNYMIEGAGGEEWHGIFTVKEKILS